MYQMATDKEFFESSVPINVETYIHSLTKYSGILYTFFDCNETEERCFYSDSAVHLI